MKKYFVLLLLFILSFIVLTLFNCGLEDTLYVQPLSEFDTYDTNNNYPTDEQGNLESVFTWNQGYVRCKADNQEYERRGGDDFYLLVGYDIYYSFTSGSNFRKANVYNPFLSKDDDHEANPTLYNVATERFPNGDQRFPRRYFEALYDSFYSQISFPIMITSPNMIPYLDDRDYNVRFCFYDDTFNNGEGGKNPFINNGAVCLDNLGPNYTEYQGLNWYKKILENAENNNDRFYGFYDYRYYKNKSITPYANSGSTTHIYKMWFYAVANAFSSSDEVDRIPGNYATSSKTATFTIYFEVDESKVTIYD